MSVNLFQQVEQGFDKLFNYNRQQIESFNYQNTMKNGSISEQIKLQEQKIQSCERKIDVNQDSNQKNNILFNSLIRCISLGTDFSFNPNIPKEQTPPEALKRKKKRRRL